MSAVEGLAAQAAGFMVGVGYSPGSRASYQRVWDQFGEYCAVSCVFRPFRTLVPAESGHRSGRKRTSQRTDGASGRVRLSRWPQPMPGPPNRLRLVARLARARHGPLLWASLWEACPVRADGSGASARSWSLSGTGRGGLVGPAGSRLARGTERTGAVLPFGTRLFASPRTTAPPSWGGRRQLGGCRCHRGRSGHGGPWRARRPGADKMTSWLGGGRGGCWGAV